MILATGNWVNETHSALTFIELMLVIAIIIILATISIPQFRKTFNYLQLNSFTADLQSFMNYLQQRSIIEEKIIFLNINKEENQYWAQIKDRPIHLKTYSIPKEINFETDKKQILFYPDGQIDKVNITLSSPDNQHTSLTTIGVYGGVKILPQD